jgi:hypothetical protein
MSTAEYADKADKLRKAAADGNLEAVQEMISSNLDDIIWWINDGNNVRRALPRLTARPWPPRPKTTGGGVHGVGGGVLGLGVGASGGRGLHLRRKLGSFFACPVSRPATDPACVPCAQRGTTALQLASMWGQLEVCRVLLGAGADKEKSSNVRASGISSFWLGRVAADWVTC